MDDLTAPPGRGVSYHNEDLRLFEGISKKSIRGCSEQLPNDSYRGRIPNNGCERRERGTSARNGIYRKPGLGQGAAREQEKHVDPPRTSSGPDQAGRV